MPWKKADTPAYYSEQGWQTRPTATWNNTESFWPTPESLYRMLDEHGYPTVFAGTPGVTTDRNLLPLPPSSWRRGLPGQRLRRPARGLRLTHGRRRLPRR